MTRHRLSAYTEHMKSNLFTAAMRIHSVFTILLLMTATKALAHSPVPPNAHAFKGWQPVEGYVTSHIDLNKLPKVQLNCPADPDGLYPTHPQQEVKHYHRFDWGTYDHFKLKGDDEGCSLGSRYKNANGEYSCLRPDTVYSVVMSDVYRDRCGHLYRAYWQLLYLKTNENMGTLFSLGRTLYPNPNSSFPNDFVMGDTYRVSRAQVLFLSAPLTGDREKIIRSQQSAQRTHRFDPERLLFFTK